jgi:hypothetical protein
MSTEPTPQQSQEPQATIEPVPSPAPEPTPAASSEPKPDPIIPEKYDFKLPDGVSFDETGIAAFSEFAKENKLSQESAQGLLSKLAPALAQRQEQALEQVKTQWADTAKADKEFGGDKLNENLAIAKKAIDKFGSPELSAFLNESGLGNHPEIIRAFYRAGKAISEDVFVGGGNRTETDPARLMYPTMK